MVILSFMCLLGIRNFMVVGTVQQMLLGQIIGSVVTVDHVAGLDGAEGSEGSTATALGLVLDRAHHALGDPGPLLGCGGSVGQLSLNDGIELVNGGEVLADGGQT